MFRLIFAAIAAFSVSSVASAHPLDLGYFQVQANEGGLRAVFELNPKAAEQISGAADLTDAPSVARQNLRLFAGTFNRIGVTSQGVQCAWQDVRSLWTDANQIAISAQATCPNADYRALHLQFFFLKFAPPVYQILGKAIIGERERSFLIEEKYPEVDLVSAAPSRGISQYVQMGIQHIGAMPSEWKDPQGLHLPDGIDHILFLLALILGGGGFWCILKTATGFTLGHSITLAIASLGLLRLPGKAVESAIALSIVFVAFEAMIHSRPRNRWKVAAFFGLVHGFGFATALQELHLSPVPMLEALLGFNFGVELGQALIIGAVLPVIWLVARQPRIYWATVRCSSALIAIAGSYWFYIRAFT